MCNNFDARNSAQYFDNSFNVLRPHNKKCTCLDAMAYNSKTCQTALKKSQHSKLDNMNQS